MTHHHQSGFWYDMIFLKWFFIANASANVKIFTILKLAMKNHFKIVWSVWILSKVFLMNSKGSQNKTYFMEKLQIKLIRSI